MKLTQIELQNILYEHRKWLCDEECGERANLSGADLRCADLNYADLRYADLSYADLSYADLRCADLNGAYLNGTILSGTDLRDVGLRDVKGLLSPIDYLEKNFEKTTEGYIAYKTFNCGYDAPKRWVVEPNSIITENVNFTRTNDYGCGINVAPLEWVREKFPNQTIWKVLIKWEWLAGVCVPYNTDGKIRCERVQLLEIVEDSND